MNDHLDRREKIVGKAIYGVAAILMLTSFLTFPESNNIKARIAVPGDPIYVPSGPKAPDKKVFVDE